MHCKNLRDNYNNNNSWDEIMHSSLISTWLYLNLVQDSYPLDVLSIEEKWNPFYKLGNGGSEKPDPPLNWLVEDTKQDIHSRCLKGRWHPVRTARLWRAPRTPSIRAWRAPSPDAGEHTLPERSTVVRHPWVQGLEFHGVGVWVLLRHIQATPCASVFYQVLITVSIYLQGYYEDYINT